MFRTTRSAALAVLLTLGCAIGCQEKTQDKSKDDKVIMATGSYRDPGPAVAVGGGRSPESAPKKGTSRTSLKTDLQKGTGLQSPTAKTGKNS
jgi:hypothetical protein